MQLVHTYSHRVVRPSDSLDPDDTHLARPPVAGLQQGRALHAANRRSLRSAANLADAHDLVLLLADLDDLPLLEMQDLRPATVVVDRVVGLAVQLGVPTRQTATTAIDGALTTVAADVRPPDDLVVLLLFLLAGVGEHEVGRRGRRR